MCFRHRAGGSRDASSHAFLFGFPNDFLHRTSASAPPVVKPTPCEISDGACVQLSTNRSWVVRGDEVVHGPVPITHGRKGHETPVGKFPVPWKVEDDWSIPCNGRMPWSTYLPATASRSTRAR